MRMCFFIYVVHHNKDRASLSHGTLERLLQLHLDNDFQAENYDHAIELFLTEYSDGTVRKRARHAYPSKQKNKQSTSHHFRKYTMLFVEV